MCRYASSGPYKEKYACFHCRKVFRQADRTDIVQKVRTDSEGRRLVNCPECRRPMQDMGKDFQVPRQSDIRQWRKVALLYAKGYTYHSCGCGPGYRPATLQEVPVFLAEKQEQKGKEERNRIRQLRKKR